MPLSDVGESMTWGEAFRLTRELATDPGTHVAAALNGWQHACERTALVMMDLFDLQHKSKVDKGTPKPYPRPWATSERKRFKPSTDLTQAEIVAALRAAGHTAELPVS